MSGGKELCLYIYIGGMYAGKEGRADGIVYFVLYYFLISFLPTRHSK